MGLQVPVGVIAVDGALSLASGLSAPEQTTYLGNADTVPSARVRLSVRQVSAVKLLPVVVATYGGVIYRSDDGFVKTGTGDRHSDNAAGLLFDAE